MNLGGYVGWWESEWMAGTAVGGDVLEKVGDGEKVVYEEEGLIDGLSETVTICEVILGDGHIVVTGE
jgi:hypothetical protein